MTPDNRKLPILIKTTILLACFALIITVRLHWLSVPLERDEGEYAYAAQIVSDGVLYRDLYTMKWPGAPVLYSIAFDLLGPTPWAIRVLHLIVSVTTLLGMYVLGRRIGGDRFALFAASCFAVMSLAPGFDAPYANTEQFVILFAVVGFAVLMMSLDDWSRRWLLLAGVLFGIAVLVKQHAALFLFAAAAYLLLDRKSWRDAGINLAFFLAGSLAIGLLVAVGLIKSGTWDSFVFWTIEYPRSYVSQIPASQMIPRLFVRLKQIYVEMPALWTLVFLAVPLLALVRLDRKHKLLIAGLLVFSFIATSIGLLYRPHYFVLMLPALALLVAAAADLVAARRAATAVTLVALCLLASILQQRDFLFAMEGNLISRRVHGINPFPESPAIAQFIADRTRPDDRIAVLGSEPQIYFLADRRAATPFIYMYPLMELHPHALDMQKQLIRDIEGAEPKIIVFVEMHDSWLTRDNSERLIYRWFEQYVRNYDVVGLVTIDPRTGVQMYGDAASAAQAPRPDNWIEILQRKSR